MRLNTSNEIGIEHFVGQAFCREQMDLWFFHLDYFAACVCEFGQFRIQRIGNRENRFAKIFIIKVADGHCYQLSRDGSEFDGLRGEALSCFPDRGVLKRASADGAGQVGHDARFENVVQDMSSRVHDAGAPAFFAVCIGALESIHASGA